MFQQPYFEIALLSIIGTFELALGIYILKKYQRTPAITYFGLMSVAVGIWVNLNGLNLLFPRTSIIFNLTSRFAFVDVVFIFIFLYFFILSFPHRATLINSGLKYFAYLVPAIFFLWFFFSKSLVIGFNNDTYGQTIYGSDYWIYSLIIFFLFLLAIIEMIRKLPGLDGIHRWQMKMILSGITISGIVGFTAHLIIPYYFKIPAVGWVGPGFSAVWLIFTGRVLLNTNQD